jgi:hypothetical protein
LEHLQATGALYWRSIFSPSAVCLGALTDLFHCNNQYERLVNWTI